MSLVGLRVFDSHFDRAKSYLELLARLRTTDLSDGMRRSGTMAGMAPITVPAPRMLGFAVTVSAPVGGFDMVKMGLERCRAGDVLVVAARGDTSNALWGGNLSLGAQRRGVAGFVTDGAVRDVEEIGELGFPVFARGTAVSAAPIEMPYGEVNTPVACGGVVVNPGDLIVGDADGVVVVRPADVEDVARATEAVLAGHRSVRAVLEAGEVTNLDAIVARLKKNGLSLPTSPPV
jgi:regulator of RNase E activity RraA